MSLKKIKKGSKRTIRDKSSKKDSEPNYEGKFKIKIPDECDTLGKELKWLSGQAEKPLQILDVSHARNTIKIGQLLLIAKQRVKRKAGPKKDWTQYLTEYFPKHKRTAQIAADPGFESAPGEGE